MNISDTYVASHIRTLTWYHNDTELQSSDRITMLNNDGTGLNSVFFSSDAGSYRVEITSLAFGDPICDSL